MYDQFYELSGRPFQLTPDPRFYFESATHRKALSYLGYGLAQGEGFIVITGEIGAGKTTLVRHLMETVDPGRLTAATIVTTQVEGHDLLGMVTESFGLSMAGKPKSEMLRGLEDFLHAEAREGRRCLLVVDEAQNLPTDTLEELRMLSNFQLGNQALLQIFLLGQPEFRDKLRDAPGLEQLRQRVIATHHLDAMQASEIEPYIIHRLSKVDWNGRPDITVDAISRLYDASGGVPRKLNMLLTRVLLMGAVERRERIDGALVDTVLADIQGDAPAADPTTNPPETPRSVDAAAVEDIPETPIEPNEPVQDEALDSITAFDGPKNAPVRFFRPDKPPPVYDAPEADGAADMRDDPMIAAAPEYPVAAIAHDLGDISQQGAEETSADEAGMAEYDEPAMPAMEATADHSTPGHDGSHDNLGASAARIDELAGRIDLLSGRVADQEETIRRLVTILLEYVERDEKPAHHRAA